MPTTRLPCPLPDCEWVLDHAAASPDGPSARSAEILERTAQEHLLSHSVREWAEALAAARTERDQYAAAARHIALRLRQTAHHWATTLPDTVSTEQVVKALWNIAGPVPDRVELRDDLWIRIAGAYEARFENDGHPEDARAAADEAMSVVQPELDTLRTELGQAEAWQRHWKWEAVGGNLRLHHALAEHRPAMDGAGLATGLCSCGEPKPCSTRRAAATREDPCRCAEKCPAAAAPLPLDTGR